MRCSTTRRIVLGLIAVLVVASEALAQSPALRRATPADAPRWSITHISGGVYRAMANNHGAVFLVTADGIILADPISPEFARWLKAEFATRFKVPVRYVIYSHYHWDHASGGDVFADTARFVGHANMLSHLALPPPSTTLAQVVGQYEPVAKLDANRNGVFEKSEAPADLQRFPGSTQSQFDGFDANRDGALSGAEVVRGPISFVRPPDITYTDRMQISLGGKRVDVSWVGEMNHSNDSSLIAFPDDSVLFMVDFVTFGRLPNREMDYELGQFEGWMTAIRKAEALAAGFTFVATGHGPVGTAKEVTAWREYFDTLRAEVAAGIAAGQTLEQMQRSITMSKYSHWGDFDWVSLNVLGMYHFLTDAR